MKLTDYIVLVKNETNFVDYLIERGIFKNHEQCPTCGSVVNLNPTNLSYRCDKTVGVKNSKKKIKLRCGFKKSARRHTFFDAKLGLEKIGLFVGYFLFMPHPRTEFLRQELDMSSKSVVNWSNVCREVCIYWCQQNSEKVGGPGKIVEIDEAKLGKGEHIIDGQWLFGGIERQSKKMFLVSVPERSKDALLQIIKEWVLDGSTIMSDCWKSYDCLQDNGYQHLRVNHSLNFVDPETGAHTQNIERTWREVREKIPKYGTRKKHYVGYLAEFVFKKKFDFGDKLENFYETAKDIRYNI